MKALAALIGMLLISSCQAIDPLSGLQDPHSHWWSIDFQGPSYMVGYLENSVVEDINSQYFKASGGRALGTGNPGQDTEAARGWYAVSGNVMPVTGAALPKRIYVRWQSVVEPKVYKGWVEIPEHARQIMSDSINRRCAETPNRTARYGAALTLGLAPGGVVQVWVYNSCHAPVKVARAQAEVELLGPHLGKAQGHYYPQTDLSKRYIERYGIPYGSW